VITRVSGVDEGVTSLVDGGEGSLAVPHVRGDELKLAGEGGDALA